MLIYVFTTKVTDLFAEFRVNDANKIKAVDVLLQE